MAEWAHRSLITAWIMQPHTVLACKSCATNREALLIIPLDL